MCVSEFCFVFSYSSSSEVDDFKQLPNDDGHCFCLFFYFCEAVPLHYQYFRFDFTCVAGNPTVWLDLWTSFLTPFWPWYSRNGALCSCKGSIFFAWLLALSLFIYDHRRKDSNWPTICHKTHQVIVWTYIYYVLLLKLVHLHNVMLQHKLNK